MTNARDLSHTIIPKSDQLNSEQLISGPITVTVTKVTESESAEQPVLIHYEGENGRPFKPCKTMRKLLIFALGKDGTQWVGRQLTLYNDPAVKFGGAEVGGIRISHISGIDKEIRVNLTSTRGKKALYVVKPMDAKARSAPATAPEVAASAPPASRERDVEPAGENVEYITENEVATLETLCSERGVSVERLRRKAQVEKLSLMPAAKFAAALDWVKNARPDA
jgi:hypothetical protein